MISFVIIQEKIFVIPFKLPPTFARFQKPHAWSELEASAGSHSFLTSGFPQFSSAALVGDRRLRKKTTPEEGLMPIVLYAWVSWRLSVWPGPMW